MYEKTELNQNVMCNMQNAMHHTTTNLIINPLNFNYTNENNKYFAYTLVKGYQRIHRR